MMAEPADQSSFFVHRVDRPKFWAEVGKESGLVFAMAFIVGPIIFVILGSMPILPKLGIALAAVVIIPLLEVRSTYSWHHKLVDQEGIAVLIDQTGVYLGGRYPLHIDWPDLDEVDLSWQYPPNHPETSSSGSTDPWPEVVFKTRSAQNPPRILSPEQLRAIRSVVSRHAPTVRITGDFH